MLRTPESSAANLLWAATAPSEVVAGRYVSNAHLATPNKVCGVTGGGEGGLYLFCGLPLHHLCMCMCIQ